MELGRGGDRAEHAASRCSSRSTTAGARRSSTRPRRFDGGDEEDFAPAALRAGDARPGPAHPHERRAAHLELPAVAVARTPSSCSATSCGRTSPARRSRRRSTSSRRASAASAAADGRARPTPPPRRRPARDSRGGAPRRRGGSDLGARVLVAIPAIAFALFIVAPAAGSSPAALIIARHRLHGRAVHDAAPREPGPPGRVRWAWSGCSWRRSSAGPTRCSPRSSSRCRSSSCSAQMQPRCGAPGLSVTVLGAHLDRGCRSPTRCCCATCRTATRSSSTCSSGRSSATPAPTSAAARSAGARSRRDLAEQDRRGTAHRDDRGRRAASGSPGSTRTGCRARTRCCSGSPWPSPRRSATCSSPTSSATRGTKDTGALFGAHGGALDRLDAVLFSAVVGYYVWQAML